MEVLSNHIAGSLCSVGAKVLNCSLKVRKCKVQLYFYILFQTNTFGKDMNAFILQVYAK